MTKRLALAVLGAFSMSLLAVGPAQAVCDPHCTPHTNKGGVERGYYRADQVGQGEKKGLETAAQNPGKYRPAGDPVPPPTPTPPPDADGDGIADVQDLCPNEAGPAPSGCPPPPPGS